MRTVDVIRRKRDGGTLRRREIQHFVAGVTDGTIPDYQAAALLMAIVLRGMSADETAQLTDAMVRSGVRVEFDGQFGIPVDKHSTGGVGDKTSLILAPLAIACGAAVPMMSGRGLGHTGGTLDKLESIPGFRTALSLEEFRAAVAAVGGALIGQTAEIAPADRRLYALRDVTGTVESIPLISASIMSKKIAEGIGALVLDVKTGGGAFMKTLEDSRRLAQSLVAIGNASGVRTEAVVTRMDAPLGREVGNANEVIESIETLKGKGPADLEQLSVLLAARMLVLAGVADSQEAAEHCCPPVARLGDGRRGVPAHHRAPGWRCARHRRLRTPAPRPGRASGRGAAQRHRHEPGRRGGGPCGGGARRRPRHARRRRRPGGRHHDRGAAGRRRHVPANRC